MTAAIWFLAWCAVSAWCHHCHLQPQVLKLSQSIRCALNMGKAWLLLLLISVSLLPAPKQVYSWCYLKLLASEELH